MEEEIFYAVQHGDNYDWDTGSRDHDRAVEMAKELTVDPFYDREEIRIAAIDTTSDFCISEEIIREGYRG